MKTRIKSHVIIASSNGKRVRRRVATIATPQRPVVQRHNHNLTMA